MGRGFQSGMGGFGGINMNQLMKQAKKMQEEMEKTQEDLASKVFESTAGGGAISVKANGKKQITEIDRGREDCFWSNYRRSKFWADIAKCEGKNWEK